MMELIGQDKKVGDLVIHTDSLESARGVGIVLKKRGDRIYVAHNNGSLLWANDWYYWKIAK